MRGYFTKLDYELCGQRRTLELGKYTWITGPNRVGKTTALRAYRAAIEGFPKRGTNDFVGPGQVLLRARVESDESFSEASCLVIDGIASAQRQTVTCSEPFLNLIAPDVDEIVSFGSQRLREELFRRFGRLEDFDLKPPAAFDGERRQLWLDLLGGAATPIKAAENARAQIRQLGDRITAVDLLEEDVPSGVQQSVIQWKVKQADLKRILDVLDHRIADAIVLESANHQLGTADTGFTVTVARSGKDVWFEVDGRSTLLSGSELGALRYSVLRAWADGDRDRTRYTYLIEAEKDLACFDVERLPFVLSTFNDYPPFVTQVLIAAPNSMRVNLPHGWTRVEMGAQV